jgi:hypothetical protein
MATKKPIVEPNTREEKRTGGRMMRPKGRRMSRERGSVVSGAVGRRERVER